MITEKETTRISKFLSLVLRHQPEIIGITLDENGWVDADLLIKNCNEKGLNLDIQILKHVVATNSKKRFAFNEQSNKIRASQGHSLSIDLGYNPQKPPKILYHGTSMKYTDAIWQNGLEKRLRQHVHLSADMATAMAVGQRHGKPFVFEVLAEAMYNDHHHFFLSDNDVWLTDHVPVKYLKAFTGS